MTGCPLGNYDDNSDNVVKEVCDQVNYYKDFENDFIKTKDVDDTKRFGMRDRSIAMAPLKKYAILNKPGVHRSMFRGCWKDVIGNKVCDTMPGSICGALGEEERDKLCMSDAPGGLADFEHPMDTNNDKLLRWGFIGKQCECSFKKDELEYEGCPAATETTGSKYACNPTRKYRKQNINWLVTTTQYTCCDNEDYYNCFREGWKVGLNEQYEYYDKEKSCSNVMFPHNEYNEYQPGEIWDGENTCTTYNSMSMEELQKYNKSPEENNCTKYIKKWAETCKWCKENSILPSNDKGVFCGEVAESNKFVCPGEFKCAGACSGLVSKECNGLWKPECNICKSPLWDNIPGGWEAVVDPSHPYHKMAELSYMVREFETEQSCRQPTRKDDLVSHWFEEDSTKCTFVGLDPASALQEGVFAGNNKTERVMSSGCEKVGVYENSKTNPRGCDINRTNNKDTGVTLWDGVSSRTEGYSTDRLSNCHFNTLYYKGGQCEDTVRAGRSQSHIVCARNPNLTGIGRCENETRYLSELYINGEWDLSVGTGRDQPEVISENLGVDELRRRRLAAARCCLGFPSEPSRGVLNTSSVEWDMERYQECRPGFTAPGSQACKDLFTNMFTKWTPEQGGVKLEDFGREYPTPDYSIVSENPDASYLAKAYCTMMSTQSDSFGYDEDVDIMCRKAMYNYCQEDIEAESKNSGKRIRYPLRVFDSSCKKWCTQDRTNEMSDQKGVCDMLAGRVCQQLQADGWIDPGQWERSELIKFSIGGGYTGLTAENIKNVCNCFLMGSECKGDNCSMSYCGAGGNRGLGPGRVSYEGPVGQSTSLVNKEVSASDMDNLYHFKGGGTPKWVSNMSSDFSCYDPNNINKSCYERCNYVNQNDTCWNASPTERL